MDDQIARLQNGLTLRCVSGKQMKITNRHAAFAFGTTNMNGRLECSQCDTHVRWIRGDAMFASAQNGEATVDALDGGTTRAGLAFVTRHGCVAEIHAAGSLQQIASSSRHVSKLRRRSAQN